MNNFTFLKKFFLLILISISLNGLQAQEMGLEVVNVTSCPGNTVEVDVKALNWEVVISMQFTMSWDPTVLTFVEATPGNAVFSQIFFGTGGAPDGYVGASWFDPSPMFDGVTLNDENIFTVTFDVLGEVGDCSSITFGSIPTLVEFTHKVGTQVLEFVPTFVDGDICLEVPEMGSTIVENETNGDGMGSISLSATGGTGPYTYMWNDGSTNASISNLSEGDYSCDVMDASGCSTNFGPFSIINDITESVNTIAGLNAITLTPNPATNYVNLSVDFDKAHTVTVKIYSLTGQVVYNHKVDAQTFDLQIELNDLAKGAYFLELTTETGKAVEKLIVAE